MHFKSGMPIAFLVDRFRIDDLRNGEPMNVATVSRDLSTQKTAEAEMRHLNESLEQRVEQRTIELEEEHKKLLAENFEREQADVRFQKLRNGLFRASPQPVRWRPRSRTYPAAHGNCQLGQRSKAAAASRGSGQPHDSARGRG
jgi:hypothetical protein